MALRLNAGVTSVEYIYMSVPLRRNGQMALVVNRSSLHEGDSELQYWLSRDPSERIAAVEIIRQRVFGGSHETRQGLQRVCRVIRRPRDLLDVEYLTRE